MRPRRAAEIVLQVLEDGLLQQRLVVAVEATAEGAILRPGIDRDVDLPLVLILDQHLDKGAVLVKRRGVVWGDLALDHLGPRQGEGQP